jgi:hypothetical protein
MQKLSALAVSPHVWQGGGVSVLKGWPGDAERAPVVAQTGFVDAVSDRGCDHKVKRDHDGNKGNELECGGPQCDTGHFSLEGAQVHESFPVKTRSLNCTARRASLPVTSTWRVCESEYREALSEGLARGVLVGSLFGWLVACLACALGVALLFLGGV